MTHRHTDLTQLLHRVQVHHTPAEADALAVRAAKEGLRHLAFLHAVIAQEAGYREQRRFERLLRESHLPREKTMAHLDLDQFGPVLAQQMERLQSGTFVPQAANVIA
ncbi:MAG: AAA family ATPase, partial [Blastochloris sp.]|nr:AAA family ATPase [Blastochloris sp.]